MRKQQLPITLNDGKNISYAVGNGWYVSNKLGHNCFRYWHMKTRTFEYSTPTYFDTLQEAYDAYNTTPQERLAEYEFCDTDIDRVRVNHNGDILFTIEDVELLMKSSDVDRLTQYFKEVGQ